MNGTDFTQIIPRIVNYCFAASNASPNVKEQSDEVLSGTSMQTRINAEIAYLSALGFKTKILLYGTFNCDSELIAYSNVDVEVIGVINVTSNTGTNGIHFVNVLNSVWCGFELHRIGTPATSDYRHGVGVLVQGACDDTLQILNYRSYNDCTGTLYQATGTTILDGSYPIISHFKNKGGGDNTAGVQCAGMILSNSTPVSPTISYGENVGGYGGWSAGLIQEEQSKANVNHVKNTGGHGYQCCGAMADNAGTGHWNDVKNYGSDDAGDDNDGLYIWGCNANIFSDCEGYPGKNPVTNAGSSGLVFAQNSGAAVIGGRYMPPIVGFEYTYDNANKKFRPFTGYPYIIYSIQVYCAVSNPGITIGLSDVNDGSNYLSGNVPLTTAGTTPPVATNSARIIAADGYIYLTPSAPIADGAMRVYITVMYQNAGLHGVNIATAGRAKIMGALFETSGAYGAVYLPTAYAAYKDWTMTACTNRAYRIDYAAIWAEAAMTSVPIYNSTVFGTAFNITSFAKGHGNTGAAMQNDGASVGTGAQQTIAHGLGYTPTAQQIALTPGSATAIPFHSAPPDATNIYVTAIVGQNWYWATVGG